MTRLVRTALGWHVVSYLTWLEWYADSGRPWWPVVRQGDGYLILPNKRGALPPATVSR